MIGPQRLPGWMPEIVAVLRRHGARANLRLIGAAVIVGVVAGIGAILFYIATASASTWALGNLVGYESMPRPGGEPRLSWLHVGETPFRPWLLLIVPTIGGLLSGLFVFTFAPEAEGHGTDAVISAYHNRDGFIRPRVPLVKILASALTIGSGGSGGREGPIAQIGAGFGSFLARLMRLRASDRRILAAAGMGAGIAAIFRAPLAGALFASEVLYSSPEFEPEVIIPAGIASVVSYCTFGAAFGWGALFNTPDLRFHSPLELGPYLLLALCMVIFAAAYTRFFIYTTRWFQRMRLSPRYRPALGAALTGAVGLVLYLVFRDVRVLNVMSFGYGSLQAGLQNETSVTALVLLAIAVGKIVTTSLTIGSGGSGGVFGPSMVIGGCAGGALGVLLHRWAPELVPHPASFVIVGMAGFFAAAAKTPFSTLIIVTEMTGGYHLLLPTLWVCVIAFVVSDRLSLYSSQLETRSFSPAHRPTIVRNAFGSKTIAPFIQSMDEVPFVRQNDTLEVVVDRFMSSSVDLVPILDGNRALSGVLDRDDIVVAMQSAPGLVIADDLARIIAPLSPDTPLDVALTRFVENNVLALPVVDIQNGRCLGLVRRGDVSKAYMRIVSGEREEAQSSSQLPRKSGPLPSQRA